MDWLKLFALLVVVASVQITADVPKKKIRIHLPQKVKHIHHHKKIYITNHPASSQYAPAFMPSAEGAVAVPTNVAMPAVASVLPLNSVELYDELPTRLPGISSVASKLLPLYRARGYYGPTPSEWDEQDYDVGPPEDPTGMPYLPTAFGAQSAAPTAPTNYPPKRVKIVKVNEPAVRKPVPRKNKPKRVAVRNKPQPQVEEEHPVTSFHEQFYSDLGGSGTIRKIKKPQRVEKIIDGDTEHIHTYSEEHIHKLVFDDGSKIPGVVGLDSVGSMTALAASHPLVPLKKPQALIAIPPDSLTGFTAVGSMGTPSHLEYAAYNPREVTHDHIFHDHGEIPAGVDLTKNHLPFPTRMTYTNHGLRLGVGTKGLKSKYPHKHLKSYQKPSQMTDFSYYENFYTPYNKIRNIQKPTLPTPFESSNDANIDYRPVVPSFKLKNKANVKPRHIAPALYYGHGKQVADYRLQQASNNSPYAVSSTVVHEYKPKQYQQVIGTVGHSKFNKDIYSYSNNNYDLDSYVSSSNIFTSENYPQNFPIKKGKKKSISTQNISFGGLDHQTTVDHMQDTSVAGSSLNGVVPSAFDNTYDQTKPLETAPSTLFTIRESSPVHPYYNAMAVKALHNDDNSDQLSLAEASNNNYQYAEAPSASTASDEPPAQTTASAPDEYYNIQSSETITTEATNYDTIPRSVSNEQNSDGHKTYKESRPRYKIIALQPQQQTYTSQESDQKYFKEDSQSATGKLKYGDKI